jgi:hypothetical protein
MEKTAVEWLEERLNRNGLGLTIEEIKQAKEMEKQQIIDAHIHAQFNVILAKKEIAEQYYNETFKSE